MIISHYMCDIFYFYFSSMIYSVLSRETDRVRSIQRARVSAVPHRQTQPHKERPAAMPGGSTSSAAL